MIDINLHFEDGYGWLPVVKVRGKEFYRGEYHDDNKKALEKAMQSLEKASSDIREYVLPSGNLFESTSTQGEKVTPSKVRDLYHLLCPRLPKVVAMTDKRVKAIKARCNEDLLRDLESWRNYFDYVGACAFLNGFNDRSWKADFDFLIRPDTAVKCQEGKYDGLQS